MRCRGPCRTNALDFFFADSRRRVRPEDVKDIVSDFRRASKRTVYFFNEPVEEVIESPRTLD